MADDPIDEEVAEGRPVSLHARFGRRVRAVSIDLSPLRTSRDFRLLWFGEIISESGHQITVVAVFYQVFRLTHSPVAVGLVGLVQLIPLLIATIGGGPLVDRVDRRILLLWTQILFAITSGILLYGAVNGHPPLALIYIAVTASAACGGLASPTRSSLVPNLVPREQLAAAISLNQLMWNAAMVIGPAIGGIVIAKAGLTWAYFVDVVTYAFTIGAAVLMSPQPPRRDEQSDRPSGWHAVVEAFSFLQGRRVLQSTFIVDLVAMVFGMPRALFPILAVTQFHKGPEVVGALFSAISVGAVAGVLTSGWMSRIEHQGRAVLIAVGVWGAGIAGFGLTGRQLVPALFLLALAGAADVISAVFRGVILQSNVPDALRGRLSAVHILVVTGGPRLGDMEAGIMAQLFSPAVSVVSGGLICVAGVVILALGVPELRRYRAAR
ncbi:MAG: MFS transporter [Actinomycetota bacterium]|nr:MFS transporter [Actinomycetota bacterium]